MNLWFYFSIFKDFSSKKSRESEKLFFSGPAKEEKKKQILAHKGFRIPKKVIFFIHQIHRPQTVSLLKKDPRRGKQQKCEPQVAQASEAGQEKFL